MTLPSLIGDVLTEVAVDPISRWPWRRLLVRGPSMRPTLRDRDVVIVNFRAFPSPGAVVLVRWAARPHQLSIKRAIRQEAEGWHVAGDNHLGSTDSRQLGPATVLGVVRWRLWPGPGRVR